MKCWNCAKQISDAAKMCPHCEASMENASDRRNPHDVQQVFEQFPPEFQEMLREAAAESDTAEEFARALLIGDCPKCGSSQTGDCENDPEIEDNTQGRCFDCGYSWCLECGRERATTFPECICVCFTESENPFEADDVEDVDTDDE